MSEKEKRRPKGDYEVSDVVVKATGTFTPPQADEKKDESEYAE